MSCIAAKEIQDMFKRLARQFHPDRNFGDPTANQKFFAINQAHQVLTDPDKRAEYDKKVRQVTCESLTLTRPAAATDGQAQEVEHANQVILPQGIQ